MGRCRFFFFLVLIIMPLSAMTEEELRSEFMKTLIIPSIEGEFHVTLISQRGDERKVIARIYQKRMEENRIGRLFLFEFPPSIRGTGLLIHSCLDGSADNMWIYLPAVNRIKRIALESSGGGYFMGSDFTYLDLLDHDRDDMEYELLDDALIDGIECYTLRTRGITEEIRRDIGYSYTLNYHRKDNFMVQRIEYFDLAGELLKVYCAEGFLNFNPGIYPLKVTMTNVQTGHRSIIEMVNTSSAEIPDSFFTARYLTEH